MFNSNLKIEKNNNNQNQIESNIIERTEVCTANRNEDKTDEQHRDGKSIRAWRGDVQPFVKSGALDLGLISVNDAFH